MSGLVAFLCSGQGGQHPGMFDLVADSPEAHPVFASATQLLGRDPRTLVRDEAAIFEGTVAQVLCCTQALAAWAALGLGKGRAVIAGYSVGELAAWGCAGMLDAGTTLTLAHRRAALMEAAAPPHHGLAGIVGLPRPVLDGILSAHGASVAIVNADDSFVVGGALESLDALCRDAAARGATRTVVLPVSVPSHTPFLAGAVAPFEEALRAVVPRPPRFGVRLLSGLDGNAVQDVDSGSAKLARQIASPIDWAACLDACRASGARLVLELGPGTALSRMAARVLPAGTARAVEDFRTIDGLRSWLARAAD
jgi:[acyl-carrier-protein] S-malonyltransferase